MSKFPDSERLESDCGFFFFFFLAVLGLGGCAWPFFLVAASGGYSLLVVHRFLIAVASLIAAEHGV